MTTQNSSVNKKEKKERVIEREHTPCKADGVVVAAAAAAAVTNTDYHRRRTSMSLAFITYDDERADDVLEKENEKQRRRNTINYTLVGALWIFTKIDGKSETTVFLKTFYFVTTARLSSNAREKVETRPIPIAGVRIFERLKSSKHHAFVQQKTSTSARR